MSRLKGKKINHFYLACGVFCLGLGTLLAQFTQSIYVSWYVKHDIWLDSGANFVFGILVLATGLIFYASVILLKGVFED